jgi:transmembrane sensor
MTTTQNDSVPPLPEPISEQAGLWDARMRSPHCTDDDRARFIAWRDADPAHRAEFERLQAMFEALSYGSTRADVRGLREIVVENVSRRRRRVVGAAVACLGVCIVAIATHAWRLQLPWLERTQSYVTRIGERSTVTLSDGSVVDLNAGSKLEVRFSEQRRAVQLLQGQALFHVTKDPLRPFVVQAANREIVAVGTAFDVRLSRTAVQVTLLEGKVTVDRKDLTDHKPDPLSPGERLTAQLAGATPAQIRSVNVAQVTGWREGRVFIEDLSLADAVAEMNRHSLKQIVIDDPTLAAERVNGMFRAGDQDAFVAMLKNYYPLEVSWHDDSQVVLRLKTR